MQHWYLCIDQKSFFASVEAVARGLDPMTTKLVVADPERSENTICLAVTPAMKALGDQNRCRIKDIPKHIDYIVAQPRMQLSKFTLLTLDRFVRSWASVSMRITMIATPATESLVSARGKGSSHHGSAEALRFYLNNSAAASVLEAAAFVIRGRITD